jgi:hypothetical protein
MKTRNSTPVDQHPVNISNDAVSSGSQFQVSSFCQYNAALAVPAEYPLN